MKRAMIPTSILRIKGRPFTGAWIETSVLLAFLGHHCGRPFTGAWIETASGLRWNSRA